MVHQPPTTKKPFCCIPPVIFLIHRFELMLYLVMTEVLNSDVFVIESNGRS